MSLSGHAVERWLAVITQMSHQSLKAHYATFLAKMTLIMLVESYSDGSATISGSFGGSVIAPCRLSKEKAHMQLALFGPTQSGCDAAEVSNRASKM